MFNIIDTRVNALDAKINAYLILFRYDYSRNKGLLIFENGASYLIGSYIERHVVDGVDGVRDVAQTLLERPLGVAAAFRSSPACPGRGTRTSEPSSALNDRWWWK